MKSSFVSRIKNSLTYRVNRKLETLLWKQLDLKWQLQSGIVVKIKSQAEWVIYNDIFVDREYDLPIQQVAAAGWSGRPLHILDLGANVGFLHLG